MQEFRAFRALLLVRASPETLLGGPGTKYEDLLRCGVLAYTSSHFVDLYIIDVSLYSGAVVRLCRLLNVVTRSDTSEDTRSYLASRGKISMVLSRELCKKNRAVT